MRLLFACAALLLTSGCSSVPVKDGLWCADRGKTGATCWHDLATEIPKKRLTKEEWDKQRFGWVCGSPQTFADKNASIEIFCQNSNLCTYELKTTVEKFNQNLKESSK